MSAVECGAEEPRLRVMAGLWDRSTDYSELDWQTYRDGVEIFPLYGDREQGAAAALLRYQPGARIPRHRHSSWEHIVVLRGSQSDELAEYPEGSLVLNGPDSEHTVISPDGCIVLVIWSGPVVAL